MKLKLSIFSYSYFMIVFVVALMKHGVDAVGVGSVGGDGGTGGDQGEQEVIQFHLFGFLE